MTADLVWFSDDLAARLRDAIGVLAGAPAASVCLAASHSHSTPNPEARFLYGTPDPSIAPHIERRVLEVVRDALARQPADVTAEFGTAQARGLAIHRRRPVLRWSNGGLRRRSENRPHPERTIDDRVTALSFRGAGDKELKALVFHFTCHPVCDPADTRGGDYPAAARMLIAAELRGVPCLFLQGFCGDIRPDLPYRPRSLRDHLVRWVRGPSFRKAVPGDTAALAAGLAQAVHAALQQARPRALTGFETRHERQPLRDRDGRDLSRHLDITTWSLGDGVQLLFANGEMLSGFAPELAALNVGYANGMVGYVAPRGDVALGGYEIEGFAPKFALLGPFALDSGDRFLAGAQSLLHAGGVR